MLGNYKDDSKAEGENTGHSSLFQRVEISSDAVEADKDDVKEGKSLG